MEPRSHPTAGLLAFCFFTLTTSATQSVTLCFSLIIFRGPRISNAPAATRSSPPALLSSLRAESDGSMLDTAYDTAIDDADSAEKLQLPYFHNQSSRPSGSTDHLNSLPSRMHPDARIPMVPCPPVYLLAFHRRCLVVLLSHLTCRQLPFSYWRHPSTCSIWTAAATASPVPSAPHTSYQMLPSH